MKKLCTLDWKYSRSGTINTKEVFLLVFHSIFAGYFAHSLVGNEIIKSEPARNTNFRFRHELDVNRIFFFFLKNCQYLLFACLKGFKNNVHCSTTQISVANFFLRKINP